MNVTFKTCPGYKEDGPHESYDVRQGHAMCNAHKTVYVADYYAKNRPEEGKGVYLAAIKLADGEMLVKIGKTGDGKGGFRTRAGMLATHTRDSLGLDVEWAEIMYTIEEDDADMRTELEGLILAEATPIYGKEYFAGLDFDSFVTMVWMGRPYTERTTSYDRRHQFFQWLAKMDGLEMSPKQED